jgi:hypothetical protein
VPVGDAWIPPFPFFQINFRKTCTCITGKNEGRLSQEITALKISVSGPFFTVPDSQRSAKNTFFPRQASLKDSSRGSAATLRRAAQTPCARALRAECRMGEIIEIRGRRGSDNPQKLNPVNTFGLPPDTPEPEPQSPRQGC